MTGFGAAAGVVGGARVSVELRSVNHRFFNPSLKLPASLARWEGDVRETLRRHVARGHVTITARVERNGAEIGAIDESRFAQFASSLIALRDRHGLGGEVDVPNLAGKSLRLKVPATTQNGQVFRLKGHGMPVIGQPDARGDLYATVDVELPRQLTPEERTHFEELQRLGQAKATSVA